MLKCTMLKLSHPDFAPVRLPQDTSRVSNRVRVQLAACNLLSGRQAPVAIRVDSSEQDVMRMLQQRGGTLVAWVDQFHKARYSENPSTRRNISLSTTALALFPGSLRGHFVGTPRLTPYIVMWLSMLRTYKMHGCPLPPRRSTLGVNTWVLSRDRVCCTFAARRLRLLRGTLSY